MVYTRKELRQITGLPDKTLRWLLDRLDIQPADFRRTLFGSPVCIYSEDALAQLHAYIFQRRILKDERSKGKRCRGGCSRYLAPSQLNSQQICDCCRRKAWITNEVCRHDPLLNEPDLSVVSELRKILDSFQQ